MSLRIIVAAFLLAPLQAAAGNPAFAKPASLTTGEVLALRAQQILTMTVDETLGAPVSVVYDPETQRLVFVILDTGGDLARESIEAFRKTYLPRLIDHPLVRGVKLTDKDVLIRYVNRKTMTVVLEWSGGVYLTK